MADGRMLVGVDGWALGALVPRRRRRMRKKRRRRKREGSVPKWAAFMALAAPSEMCEVN